MHAGSCGQTLMRAHTAVFNVRACHEIRRRIMIVQASSKLSLTCRQILLYEIHSLLMFWSTVKHMNGCRIHFTCTSYSTSV